MLKASGGPDSSCRIVAKYPLDRPVMLVTIEDRAAVRASQGRMARANTSCSRCSSTPAVAGDHLQEAQRQQDRLADVLATDPAKQPDGWPLRGEILAHVDRLRSELEPRRLTPPEETRRPLRTLHHRSRTAPPRRGYRAVLRSPTVLRSRAGRTAERVRARLRALAAVVDGRDVQGEGAQVEVEGGLDVASLQADVIEHGWSLTTGCDTLPG